MVLFLSRNIQRIYNFLHNTKNYGKLICSQDYFWLGSRLEFAGQWSQAGGIARYGFAGSFWKVIPKEKWPTDEASVSHIMLNGKNPSVICDKSWYLLAKISIKMP